MCALFRIERSSCFEDCHYKFEEHIGCDVCKFVHHGILLSTPKMCQSHYQKAVGVRRNVSGMLRDGRGPLEDWHVAREWNLQPEYIANRRSEGTPSDGCAMRVVQPRVKWHFIDSVLTSCSEHFAEIACAIGSPFET